MTQLAQENKRKNKIVARIDYENETWPVRTAGFTPDSPWRHEGTKLPNVRLIMAVFAIILVFVLAVRLCILMNVPRVSVTALRSQIQAELPIGTPRPEVEQWLGKRGFFWNDLGEGPENKVVGLGGRIADIYRMEFMSITYIRFYFLFDGDGKLESWSVEQSVIGL